MNAGRDHRDLRHLLAVAAQVVGVGAVALGLGLVAPWAGLLVVGLGLIAGGTAAELRDLRDGGD